MLWWESEASMGIHSAIREHKARSSDGAMVMKAMTNAGEACPRMIDEGEETSK